MTAEFHAEENPSNGWSWKCSIRGAAEGPLAGRTVGVKDNVCVAGVPMLNGSPIMEGYVPREDATVVIRGGLVESPNQFLRHEVPPRSLSFSAP